MNNSLKVLTLLFYWAVLFPVTLKSQDLQEHDSLIIKAQELRSIDPEQSIALLESAIGITKSVNNPQLLLKDSLIYAYIVGTTGQKKQGEAIFSRIRAKSGFKLVQEDYYKLYSKFLLLTKNYNKAIGVIDSTLNQFSLDTTERIKFSINKGIALISCDEYKLAITEFDNLLKQYDNISESEAFLINYWLASIYLRNKDYENALFYRLENEKLSDLPITRKASNWYSLGVLYKQMKNDSCIAYFQKVIEKKDEVSRNTYFKALGALFGYYVKTKKDIKNAKKYLPLLKAYAKKNNYTPSYYYQQLASYQRLDNNISKAIYFQKLAKKEYELNENDDINYYNDLLAILLELKLKLNGDSESELYFQTLYKGMSDAQKKVVADEIEKWETKFQTEKKEAENQLLKQEKELQKIVIKNQRVTMYGSLVGIVLLGFLLLLLYRQNQDRKQHNQQLTKKNEKIELLHKELSHRIKNNLAFVSSLMKMQGRRLEHKEAKEAVKEGKTRIDAMSLLHQKLFIQGNSSDINLREYLEELCANIERTHPSEGVKPEIDLQIEDFSVDGETGVRIGLIINELVTNSFKYAFEHQPQPEIRIILTGINNDDIKLYYRDNGGGISKSIDIYQTKSLGLKLIRMLTQQLSGKMQSENDNGAIFQFQFKNKKIEV